MAQWVQHVSGQGEKWEVITEHGNDYAYRVRGKQAPLHPTLEHYLPKSDYRVCDPPEVWMDVTADCDVQYDKNMWSNGIFHGHGVITPKFYRVRKVPVTFPAVGDRADDGIAAQGGWAFIVEKREAP